MLCICGSVSIRFLILVKKKSLFLLQMSLIWAGPGFQLCTNESKPGLGLHKSSPPVMDDSMFTMAGPAIIEEQNAYLTAVPSNSEARQAVFHLKKWSTPGLDGCTCRWIFYLHMVHHCKRCHLSHHSLLLHRLASSILYYILHCPNPKEPLPHHLLRTFPNQPTQLFF